MATSKKVTYNRADRALLAVVGLLECGDFNKVAAEAGEPMASQELNRAADLIRKIRNGKLNAE